MRRADAAALLGVDVDAEERVVRAAFRRAARSAHPDAGGTEARFVRLVAARETLLAAAEPPPVRVVVRTDLLWRLWRWVQRLQARRRFGERERDLD